MQLKAVLCNSSSPTCATKRCKKDCTNTKFNRSDAFRSTMIHAFSEWGVHWTKTYKLNQIETYKCMVGSLARRPQFI
jgi:hypothetical protein